jgi:hypothetical protein
MMLARQNDGLHAGCSEHLGNGIGVESSGVEKIGILVAIAPFTIGERVHAEVEKRVQLEIVPGKLARRRHRSIGRKRREGGRECRGGQERQSFAPGQSRHCLHYLIP